MKNQLRLWSAAVVLFFTLPASAAIVGYVNHSFGPGDSLFSNPLEASPNNTLSSLFWSSPVPSGTMISLWNPTTLSFDTTSTFSSGAWSINFTLNPGTGARLTAPSAFTNTFVGEVRNHDGSSYSGTLTPPPLYSGPNGIFLLSDKAPVGATGNDIFLNILGRAPNVGEQVMSLTTISTYLGGGTWDNLPTLPVSGAVFLNIGPVPEPSTAAMGLLGLALMRALRRRQ